MNHAPRHAMEVHRMWSPKKKQTLDENLVNWHRSIIDCRINTLVDLCEDYERRWICGSASMNPTLAIARKGNSKYLCINWNSMKNNMAYLSHSMKDLAKHGERKRMMEVKEKSSSKFNAPIWWREGLWSINLLRRDHRVAFMVVILFLQKPSNILCSVIMPRY